MPGAIIFVNDTINSSTLGLLQTDTSQNQSIESTLAKQLEINESISLTEFNARVAADPNYPNVVHLLRLRLLVVLPDFRDYTNRNLADIVIFAKAGLASVEKNNFGPPGLTLPVMRLNIWNLINGIKGSNTACSPFPLPLAPPQTQTPENPKPHFHLSPRRIEGLGALELFGVENLEENGIDEGVFGDKLRPESRGLGELLEEINGHEHHHEEGEEEDDVDE